MWTIHIYEYNFSITSSYVSGNIALLSLLLVYIKIQTMHALTHVSGGHSCKILTWCKVFVFVKQRVIKKYWLTNSSETTPCTSVHSCYTHTFTRHAHYELQYAQSCWLKEFSWMQTSAQQWPILRGATALKCMHYRPISRAWKANSLWKCWFTASHRACGRVYLWPVSSGSEGQRQPTREIIVLDNIAYSCVICHQHWVFFPTFKSNLQRCLEIPKKLAHLQKERRLFSSAAAKTGSSFWCIDWPVKWCGFGSLWPQEDLHFKPVCS